MFVICMLFFFFNDTATTEIYTLSLHDALPISPPSAKRPPVLRSSGLYIALSVRPALRGRLLTRELADVGVALAEQVRAAGDRKSTRLNSSHANISYAVFCLKKKKKHGQSHIY